MIKRAVKFILDNSILLAGGAVAGLAWANIAPESYFAFRDAAVPGTESIGHHGLSVNYVVNEILMVFFFALAGKEVWTALLPGGALSGFRRGAMPILCAVGGMAGPAIIYVLGTIWIGQTASLGRGWAIPCATDIAFSFMIALIVFGRHHPATPFLLMLAIADDALGLIVLAVFYPQRDFQPLWLLLILGAVAVGMLMRMIRLRNFWLYIILPGAISWFGFALAGLHPALGLLPIIPVIPHKPKGEKEMHWRETTCGSELDRFEHWWKNPVELIIGLFGFVNAGVPFAAASMVTLFVLLGLLFGKPIGIFLSGLIGRFILRLALPEGLSWRALFVLGCAAGIGFTVALFVATVAFRPGPVQDASKMGALASVLAAVTAVAAAKILKVRRCRTGKT